ncbi:DegT/DnrJ/EryC1/StrS family aminotransferase [Hydrogenimonas sp. SS33]|uniref:DegT/DnrJ/EryC1/StrS family aminotransferase n=1 Tax=Hydrogenimonas leucolamina TaxID=2954236 RepID=UPI00336BB5CB
MISIPSEYRKFFYKENLYFTASASTALYLFLKARGIFRKKVIVPSNICYTVPYTILGSGNTPLFCDIDPESGNPSRNGIEKLLETDENIGALVLPHMFGNPVRERTGIRRLCREHEIAFIDDCAGALGLEDLDGGIAENADAVIFSFNYNKHIALGMGGLLATDETIDISALSSSIKNDVSVYLYKSRMIDRLYKPLLYSDDYDLLVGKLHGFNDFFADSFIYRFTPDETYKREFNRCLGRISENREYRRSIVSQLDQKILFDENGPLQRYRFEEGANPWRYNLLVKYPDIRKKLIDALLKAELPVSIWYPPVDPIYGYDMQKESLLFSKKILNFDFINASKTEIDRFVDIVNSVAGEGT